MYTSNNNSKKRLSESSPSLPPCSQHPHLQSTPPLSDISNLNNSSTSNGSSGNGSPFKKKFKNKNDVINNNNTTTTTLTPFNLSMELGNFLKNSNFLKHHKIENEITNSPNIQDQNINNDLDMIIIDNRHSIENESEMFSNVIGDDQELGDIISPCYARPDIHPNCSQNGSILDEDDLNDSMVPDSISNSSDSIPNEINTINDNNNNNENNCNKKLCKFNEDEADLNLKNNSEQNSENDTPPNLLDEEFDMHKEKESQDDDEDEMEDEIEEDGEIEEQFEDDWEEYSIDYSNTIVIHPESPIFPWVSIIHDDSIELTSRLTFGPSNNFQVVRLGNNLLIEYIVQYPKHFSEVVNLESHVEKFKMVIKHPGQNYENDLGVKFENSNLSIIIKKAYLI